MSSESESKKLRTVFKNCDEGDDQDYDDEGAPEEEDEEVRYVKKMIEFGDRGFMISLSGIESVEKDMKYFDKPKSHFEFGIIINKGIEPNIRFPKVNVESWYITEELRDNAWELLVEKLKEERFKVIKI